MSFELYPNRIAHGGGPACDYSRQSRPSYDAPIVKGLRRLSPPRGAGWEPGGTLRSISRAKKSYFVGAVAVGTDGPGWLGWN